MNPFVFIDWSSFLLRYNRVSPEHPIYSCLPLLIWQSSPPLRQMIPHCQTQSFPFLLRPLHINQNTVGEMAPLRKVDLMSVPCMGQLQLKCGAFWGGFFFFCLVLLSIELIKQIYWLFLALMKMLFYFAESHYCHFCIPVKQHVLNTEGHKHWICNTAIKACLSWQLVFPASLHRGPGAGPRLARVNSRSGTNTPESFPAASNPQATTSLPS